MSNFVNALKNNKNLLNILSDPNALSNPDSSAIQNILSDPSMVSLIGNMMSNPDALKNMGNSLRDPNNAQAIADALTDPNNIARVIKDPSGSVNSGLNTGVSKMVETSQT